MDERFHRALHLGARGRHDLVVADRDRPLPVGRAQLVDALAHDADRLAHLFHADDLTVVIVAILADGDVEIHLLVAFVGLRLAQVPGGARAAHHHARKAPGPAFVERHDADVDIALLEDAVADEEFVEIVDDLQERIAESLDVVDEDRAEDRARRRPAGSNWRASASPRRARRRPSASRVPRSPRAAASARRRPWPAWSR